METAAGAAASAIRVELPPQTRRFVLAGISYRVVIS
jgi:hypothetical protein